MVQSFLEQWGYLAILGLLFAAGLGIPFPEELTQLTAGFLAHEEVLRLWPAMLVCWIGIVGGDVTWFFVARHAGGRVLDSRYVARLLTPSRRQWLDRHFARHAFWTVAIARHASGLRLPAFALAAVHGVGFVTFVLADGLSAAVSVPLVVGAGYLFSHHLAQVHHDIRRVEIGILVALAAGAAIAVAVRRRRRRAAGP